MKSVTLACFLLITLFGCKKNTDDISNEFIAQVVGYDQNCSTCILSFPFDSLNAIKILGKSQNNYYQTVNLNSKDTKHSLLMKVKVRNALDKELKACITLYPSFNYNNIFVSEFNQLRDFNFHDTIDLSYSDCLRDYELASSFCFDSVLTDSRCPEDLICIWPGEAQVRFKIKIGNSTPILLDLYTGTNDTSINGYKFSFIDLLPHPNTKIPRKTEDYKARIIIKQK